MYGLYGRDTGFISRIKKMIDLKYFCGFLFCLSRSLSPNMLNDSNFSGKGAEGLFGKWKAILMV